VSVSRENEDDIGQDLPHIISVDDHVVEPPDLFLNALPSQFRDRAPHVESRFGRLVFEGERYRGFAADHDHPDSRWGDYWIYDDLVWPMTAGYAAIGEIRKLEAMTPVTYEEIDPGCYKQFERLERMDQNGVEASLCFPTMPRFCGQHFLEAKDKTFALSCLRAYNDWTLEVWCAGKASGRLVPVTLIPLWDPDLAAREVIRCAKKGSRAISFSECPPALNLPSIHSGHWDPVFRACASCDLVVNMHIGTASRLPSTGGDSPPMVTIALTFQNSQTAAVDWLSSGILQRFPELRIAFSEGQVGWLPFILDRLDSVWHRHELYEHDLRDRVPRLPSSYVEDRVFGCIFDDVVGLKNRDLIGVGQIMFEVDYPHADSTFPHSVAAARRLFDEAELAPDEVWAVIRGNAIRCYGLETQVNRANGKRTSTLGTGNSAQELA